MFRKKNLIHIFSGALLIAGTTIGAGMLGIPLLTAEAGFLPAIFITFAVWLFMMATGYLLLEATLWMPTDANFLSLAKKFLGNHGKWITGVLFLFLYYCLLIAYFAAGSPILAYYFNGFLGTNIAGIGQYFLFGLLFGLVVAFGIGWVSRLNYILMVGLIASYIGVVSSGSPLVEAERLASQNWSFAFFAAPILFSAFGYHNVIPSLTFYFDRNARVMRYAIFFGTFIPLVVYLFWQWLIIGALPKEAIEEALAKGVPVTESLSLLINQPWIVNLGKAFAFFAVVTSLLGVAFSMVDFLGDGLKLRRKGFHRMILTFMTFLPPFIFVLYDPSIFVTALSIAGGFGEALLNGILPVLLVWVGRYHMHLSSEKLLPGKRATLLFLILIGLAVMALEILFLLYYH